MLKEKDTDGSARRLYKKDGQHIDNSSHHTEVKPKYPEIWALPSCADDVNWSQSQLFISDRAAEPQYKVPAQTPSHPIKGSAVKYDVLSHL